MGTKKLKLETCFLIFVAKKWHFNAKKVVFLMPKQFHWRFLTNKKRMRFGFMKSTPDQVVYVDINNYARSNNNKPNGILTSWANTTVIFIFNKSMKSGPTFSAQLDFLYE